MKKSHKIIYWVATLWLSLGMTATAFVQLRRFPDELTAFRHLGYPVYLMTILAVWKLLGVIAVLVPKFQLIKEWAYAGFFFAMSGALVSHLVMGDGFKEIFGSSLLLVLIVTSWYFRPADRRLVSTIH
jgi:hypothetical protein